MLEAKIYSQHGKKFIPTKKTPGSGAYDIRTPDGIDLQDRETVVIYTGLVIECPTGFDYRIRIRSSLAARGIIMNTGVGLIDEDFCGVTDELSLIIHNLSGSFQQIYAGDRIAQMNFVKKPEEIEFVNKPLVYFRDNETRGGVGSTGRS